MAKKRRRTKRQKNASPADRPGARKKQRGLNLPSLIFIGLMLVIAVAIAIASALDDDRPECPPGQVWSQSHGHCH